MKKVLLLAGVYWLSLLALAVFLFSLTAPNLVLSTWEPYWDWQVWMWQTFFNKRQVLSGVYLLLMVVIFSSYGAFLQAAWSYRKILHNWLKTHVLVFCSGVFIMGVPLLFGMNGLSYDMFNYMFNAKMVMVYQENPHQKVALDFPDDPWVRFMHNTHTPAPYGYGWTLVSLLPFSIGMTKFSLTWFLFKLMSLVSFVLLALFYSRVLQAGSEKESWSSLVVLMNPLLVIEVLVNGHNDLWMMVPALVSLWLLSDQKRPLTRAHLFKIIISFLLLALSISIKLATITLLPVWSLLLACYVMPVLDSKSLVHRVTAVFKIYWPMLCMVLLACLLLTQRSKLFLPWYWLWVLVWFPLTPFGKLYTLVWSIVLGYSCSSLLRYLPYLWQGEFTQLVIEQQVLTTFGGGLIFTCLFYFLSLKLFSPRLADTHQVQ